MRVIVKPSLTPHLHVDITNALVSTIAAELARAQGGNDVLNWLEAERVLQDLIGSGRVSAPRAPSAGMDSEERGRRRWRSMQEPEVAVASRAGPRSAEDEAAPMSATRG